MKKKVNYKNLIYNILSNINQYIKTKQIITI